MIKKYQNIPIFYKRKHSEYKELHGYIYAWLEDRYGNKQIITPDWVHNICPNEFITDILDENFLGLSTPAFNITSTALSTDYDPPKSTSTMVKEIARKIITPTGGDGEYTVNAEWGFNEAVTATAAIDSVTSVSEIEITNVVGTFTSNDRVLITLSALNNAPIQRKVTISGTTMTFDKPVNDILNLTAGDTIDQLISKAHLAVNSDDTLNDGKALSIVPLYAYKRADKKLTTIQKIIIK